MPELRVYDAALSTHQRQLTNRVQSPVPPATLHIHYSLEVAGMAALGVTIPRKGRAPEDPNLTALWRAIPDRDAGFLIVIAPRALASEAALLTTLGHELEHVRQEIACPGILKLSETCIAFIRDTPALHAEFPTCLHAPVNAHAEIAGALLAVGLLQPPPVRQYYESEKPEAISIVQGSLQGAATDSGNARADLALFFQSRMTSLEGWFRDCMRPRLSSLADVRAFLNRPCSS